MPLISSHVEARPRDADGGGVRGHPRRGRRDQAEAARLAARRHRGRSRSSRSWCCSSSADSVLVRAGAAVFMFSALALFGVSAVYHTGRWSDRAKTIWKRFDHATHLRAHRRVVHAVLAAAALDRARGDPALAWCGAARCSACSSASSGSARRAGSTCRCTSLLGWAAQQGAWVIEDDYLSELQLKGRATPAPAGAIERGQRWRGPALELKLAQIIILDHPCAC